MPSVPFPGPRRRWLVLAVAALCVAAAGFAAPSLAQALQPLRQVFVYGAEPEVETALPEAKPVPVKPAMPVVLRVDGEEHILRSSAAQVRDLLAEQGIALGAQDRVAPGLDTSLGYGLAVRVVRVKEQLRAETQEIPFTTEYRDDPNLTRGESRVVRAGEPGSRKTVTRRIYQDGRMLRAEPAGEQVVRPPVNRVVARGTTGVVSRGGNTYRYRQELKMVATAYSPGDGHTPGTLTATGIPARKGVAAVDPKVIPLGTRLYVEGYGVALAADTGGSIKGKRIDLAHDTPAEARQFGRRTVKVYVLVD